MRINKETTATFDIDAQKGVIPICQDELPQFSEVGEPNVDIRWNSHCNVGTQGFELLDGLSDPLDYDYFAWKGIENSTHPYGACYHDLKNQRTTG